MDFVAKIVGNYYTTQISYENGVFTPDPFVIGVPNNTKLHNLTVHAKFVENKCTKCEQHYNLKLQIIESRPTFEAVDNGLPTLVIWHGWASPRGSFDFRVPTSVENFLLTAPHYFEKNTSKMYYFLLEAGTTFDIFETRRYYNKELWLNWLSCRTTGVIGHQESDYSVLLWVDGPITQLSQKDVEVKETIHRKCKEKWTSLGKVGCTEILFLRKEDGEEYIKYDGGKYDNEEIKIGDVFIYHRPEVEERKMEIQHILGKANLMLQDSCDWLPDSTQCDGEGGGCSSCVHENEWRIVRAT